MRGEKEPIGELTPSQTAATLLFKFGVPTDNSVQEYGFARMKLRRTPDVEINYKDKKTTIFLAESVDDKGKFKGYDLQAKNDGNSQEHTLFHIPLGGTPPTKNWQGLSILPKEERALRTMLRRIGNELSKASPNLSESATDSIISSAPENTP